MPLKSISSKPKAVPAGPPASMRSFGRGFTLIEIMVAVSIFVIVALIVTSTVITTSETNRKAQAIKVAIDNLSFALDSMSLKIRQGNTFECLSSEGDAGGQLVGTNCESAKDGIAFLDPGGVKRIYFFNNNDPTSGKLTYCETTTEGSCDTPLDLTDSSMINITSLDFYVWNAQSSGTDPPRPQGRPRVAISMAGETKDPKTKTDFYLQTTASGK